VIRLQGAELEAVRELVWNRDGRRCVAKGCGKPLPLHGDLFTRMHLSHIKSRGVGGSDTAENTQAKCFRCHIEREHTKGEK